MSEARRRWLWIAAINLLMLAMTTWSWQLYTESRRRLASAVADTETCRKCAADIVRLRLSSSTTAASSNSAGMPRDALPQRLYEAARACGIEPDRVIRSVRPQQQEAAHHVAGPSGDSPRKTFELSLERLTLEQLARFVHQLRIDDPRLRLIALTLNEPSGFGTDAIWNVEPLVLAYPATADLSQDTRVETIGAR
jgi:hypothetical protein